MAKVYTAQEMRDFADAIAEDLNNLGNTSVRYAYESLIPVIESLRQAADAEDELASVKARLDAVIKECEKMRDDFSKRMLSFTGMGASNMKNIYKDKIEVVDDILHSARGEP